MAKNINERLSEAFYEYLAAKYPKVSRMALREQADALAEIAVDELAGRLGAVIHNPGGAKIVPYEDQPDELAPDVLDPAGIGDIDLQGHGDHDVEGDNEPRS